MRGWKKLCIIFLCPLLLSGCWDKKELNQVAVVIGAGIDVAKNGKYRVTAQVIKPSPPKSGGSGGSELPTWALSANGDTIMDAILHLNQISPRRLYWPHLQIIIFSEEIAKQGVGPILTWFERDRDSRSGTYLVTTRGRAEDLLNQQIELGNVPAKAMADFLDTASLRQIPVRQLKMRDFMSILATPGIDPVVDVIDPRIIRGKVETYQLSGMAIFKNDQLKDYIFLPFTAGPEIGLNQFQSDVLTVPTPNRKKGGFFSFQVTDFYSRIKPKVIGNHVKVVMDIFAEGNIGDQTDSTDLVDPKIHRQAEQEIAKRIKVYILSTFKKAAKEKADIYGIGKEVRRYYPDFWHKNQKNWDKMLEDVTFEFHIDSNIRRSGLIYEPTQEKIK